VKVIFGRREPDAPMDSRNCRRACRATPAANSAPHWVRHTGSHLGRGTRSSSHGEPLLTVDSVRMARKPCHFSSEKARRELGYTPRPAVEALRTRSNGFTEHAMLSERNQEVFCLRDSTMIYAPWISDVNQRLPLLIIRRIPDRQLAQRRPSVFGPRGKTLRP